MDDVGRLWTGIGVCAAVILLMAFLTLCENAAVEFNDAKLKKMAEEDKDPKAIRLAALLGRTGRVVATNLIARSIMIIAVSVVGAIYFYAPLSNKLHKLFDVYTQASYYIIGICSFVIISCLLALVICTFGVVIPKKLCISGKVGERFILNSCVAYKALLAVFSPLAIVSGAVSAGILRLFGVKSTNKADSVTEEEILMMVDAVNETGGIEESQAEMISNIFDFDDIEVREVMTHRTEMVAVAVVAYIIALDPNSSIMGLVSNAWAGLGASFGPIILMSLYWRRTNLAGAAAGVASGALSVIIWDYIPLAGGQTLGDKTGLYSLVVGFAVSLILIIIVSLCTKKPSEEMLKAFDDVKNGINCGCDEKA